MKYVYNTSGVCSQRIEIEVDNGIITKLQFIGGCSGNTQGVARLAEGMRVEDVIARVKGIRCGSRPTSCPDQLSKALEAMLNA